MAHQYLKTLFTDSIRKVQEKLGSRKGYERMENGPIENKVFTPREIDFISRRDSFFMATVTEDNWPYVQHRGGPTGFVKVLSPQRIGFADYSGNRQYITVGNLEKNKRASIILVDYPNRTRLKIVGELEVLPENNELTSEIETSGYKAKVERLMVMNVKGFDWNCPQHITPRYTLPEIEQMKSKNNGEENEKV